MYINFTFLLFKIMPSATKNRKNGNIIWLLNFNDWIMFKIIFNDKSFLVQIFLYQTFSFFYHPRKRKIIK